MRPRFSLVVTLFLVSGSTGLLYEVAFGKLLGYVFGATAYAVSTVLAAFMGGMALGAHLGGKRAARIARPLVAYGVLEIIVGLVVAASPAALEALTAAYVHVAQKAPGSLAILTAARGALTALVVIVPTVAMGATLPILSRVVAGEVGERSQRRLSLLYAINTAGGAIGALTSAYLVLPALGVRGTIWAAALANVTIGVTAIVTGRRAPEESPAPATETSDESPKRTAPAAQAQGPYHENTALAFAFASGFIVFAAEVVETHLLALLIGNSAYAFGLMLAVFLVCLAIGAARSPALAEKRGDRALAFGLGAAAISLALTMPLWAELPRLFLFAGKHVHSWTGRELVRALAALLILAVPTVFLGTTFPLLLHRIASMPDVGARVGRLTVVNTVGTIFGSIITGYVILPVLGSQGTLLGVVAALAIASVLASRVAAGEKGSAVTRFALPAAAIVVALVLPRWDMARMTNGANVYFSAGPPPDRIEMVREDVHGGVTTVARRAEVLTLYTNGKFQGDNGPEMAAQRRFAHFPSMFLRGTEKRVLVIGLGTGTTLGTIATYPWERIEVAEISPAIVDASRKYFSGPARNSLDDPRTVLSLEDGRNHLLVSPGGYDLVTMELTSVWFAGAASLYSREFYELVRARLADGGILQQWVQLHHIRRRELAAIVRTLRVVFPHVALFVGGSQGILVASARPLVASRAELDRLATVPAIRETLGAGTLPGLLDELMASGAELDRFVGETPGEPLVSTDDNLFLEYATPKGNVLDYWQSLHETLAMLEQYRTPNAAERHLGP
ncbi:fused MFS/spermidine synthase [Polyangium mundeleinium]|uniref:Fused MFS/spermidine synthase n=1 Tax=Polyangium mundeleinium TaxID=2995306 RepID=A0ABT5EJV5_9BACT|nr:fused MFS/spermidine synthase [Polyangium mundeleinium]MDC0742118.1 fused MFS/spermidine synthase [Polyangium mundeleinium]